jgi:HK97 family phage major capsid protein
MSLSLAKKLREKRANLHEQMKAIVAKADGENRALSTEENTQFDGFHTEMESLRTQVEKIEKHEETEKELNESRGRRAGGRDETPTKTEADEQNEERNKAFEKYLRFGREEMTAEERNLMRRPSPEATVEVRAQSAGSNAGGGYTVAQDFYNKLTEALKIFGGMRRVATTLATDTGALLPMPTVNETGQTGELLGENATVNAQDITFGVVNMNAYKFSSKLVLISIELLQDTAFDITSYIARALSDRLGRIQNTKFTLGAGSGSSEPKGIVPAATLGATGTTGQTTSIIFNDLVELIHSVDPAYRPGAKFMMADSTLKVIKQLKDTQGRPLFLPGLGVKEPDTINAYPYEINQDIATMAANAKSVLFGDLTKYFIRDVKDVTVVRLNERYADAGQVGFLAFARADGNLLDAGTRPVKYYANSAT